ncbi:MAG: hypothetical protein HY238_10915 [Acidobacteria bacterium]|nr:hypothetical protein [Acidobacteriota bacterium]
MPRQGVQVHGNGLVGILSGLRFCPPVHMEPLQCGGVGVEAVAIRLDNNRDAKQ